MRCRVPVIWLSVKVSGNFSQANGEETATIVLTNNSSHVAFFLRAEVTNGVDGEEVLPVTYDDNYVTVFPHEMRTIVAKFTVPARASWSPAIRLEGYNVGKKVLPLKELRTAGSTN